jgi:hypothetical protein
MSESVAIPVASPVMGLGSVAVATAVALGGVCLTMAASAVSCCREVYKKLNEGGYPVENLQVAYTPLSNFGGFVELLRSQGFEINPFSDPGPGSSPFKDVDARDLEISMAFNPVTSERLSIVNSAGGIGVISENKDLIQSSIQGFVTQEIAFALEDIGFKVKIEENGKDKIVTAIDEQKNRVEAKIEKGGGIAKVDTRKSKRPKCDLIHQLIAQRIREKSQGKLSRHQTKKRCEHIQVRH